MKERRLDQDSEKDKMDSTKMLSKKTSEKKISVKSIYFYNIILLSLPDLQIHVGAMMYDSNKQKGVMKRQLPGPRIAEFTSTMNYAEFISSLKDMFFCEDDVVGQLAIANSCGIPFDVKSEDWTLQEFVKAHGPPSKLKIYLLQFPVSVLVYAMSY